MTFWYDSARSLSIYQTQSAILQQAIPEARQVNGQYLAIPHNLRTAQILRHFNYPVAPVITDRNYDWPIEPGRKALPHQKTMANFAVCHPRSFNLSDPGCVDAETEYLSPTGWHRIDSYKSGPVAQYHLNGKMEFVVPTAYVVRPCDWMYRLQTSRGVDQKLSAEHRVLYVDYDGNSRLTTASDVADKQERQAQGWRGRFITSFEGGASGISLTDAELRVMVAIIADGSFPYTHLLSCVINIKKERKKTRLRQLLNEAKIKFIEKRVDYESAKGYSRFRFQAPRHDKEFTAYYWACTRSQLAVVSDECWHWDGTAPVGNRGPRFFSTNKSSADFIQFAFSATGRTARVSQDFKNKRSPGIYIVGTRTKGVLVGLNGNKGSKEKTQPVTIEPTIDGKKYCFEVPTTFLVLRRNGQIFITGNTMKTLATLWAVDWLMLQHQPGTFRALVIAPLTILETVWATGIFKNFLSRRSFEILHGSAEKRRQLLAKKPDFAIINPDGVGVGAHTHKRFDLDGFSRDLTDDKAIQIVVIDEADAYCDSQTKRHRLARLIFGDRPYILPLTGTPTSQAPTDAYGIAKLVNNAFGKSFTSFRLDTMHKISNFKWVPRKDGYDKARQLLSPAIRFDIKEVWQDAPEMTTQQREIPLTDEQKKHLADLKRDLVIMVGKGQQVNAINEGAARQKFIQIVLGAVYDANHKAHVVDASPRLEEIERIIQMTPRKVLIFFPLTSIVNIVYKRLSKRWKCGIINGEVPQKERARLIRDFETDPNFKVMIMDPQPTAHGINEFVVADTVIWGGPTEKTRLYIQANKRAHRPGQKWPVTVYQLVSTLLEKEIFRRLETNTSLQGALLDAIRLGTL